METHRRSADGRRRFSAHFKRDKALANREFGVQDNTKRIRRVMDMNGWKLPRSTRRRTGRAQTGRIRRDDANERWCSDGPRLLAGTDTSCRSLSRSIVTTVR